MAIARCEKCSKEFYAKPSHLSRGWGKFCSIACRAEKQKTGSYVLCEICGKEIWKTPKDLRKSKSKKFFCNKSCQSKWRNTEYSGEKHRFWKGGIYVYRDILLRSGEIPLCGRCGTKDIRVLEAHHKDLNRKNNSAENLVWLCRNCHLLIHLHNEKI